MPASAAMMCSHMSTLPRGERQVVRRGVSIRLVTKAGMRAAGFKSLRTKTICRSQVSAGVELDVHIAAVPIAIAEIRAGCASVCW